MLEGSEHVIPNDKELSDAERNTLMRMTVEEVGVDLHVVLVQQFLSVTSEIINTTVTGIRNSVRVNVVIHYDVTSRCHHARCDRRI